VRKKALSLGKDSSLRVVKDFLLKKDRFETELCVHLADSFTKTSMLSCRRRLIEQCPTRAAAEETVPERLSSYASTFTTREQRRRERLSD
jgi:hypothetical protein